MEIVQNDVTEGLCIYIKLPQEYDDMYDVINQLSDFNIEQIDDFWGIESNLDEGDDVILFIIPMKNQKILYHSDEALNAMNIEFGVLRNLASSQSILLSLLNEINQTFFDGAYSDDIANIETQINKISEHWAKQGIELGSDQALEID